MGVRSEVVLPLWQTTRFRLLGLLPLAFFIARAVEYRRAGTPSNIQWSCHISNLLLALGMILAQPLPIRVAAFWLILGVPPWIADMFFIKIITGVSVFSHLGGFVMSLIALRQIRAQRWSWIPAWIYFLSLQQLSRLTTPPDLNVNVAHYAYGPWRDLFGSYWQYWLVDTALVGLMLWGMEWGLLKLFPPRGSLEKSRRV